jgi:hypothetical protein
MPTIKSDTNALNSVYCHGCRSFCFDEKHGSNVVDNGSKFGYGDKGVAIVHRYGSRAGRILKP